MKRKVIIELRVLLSLLAIRILFYLAAGVVVPAVTSLCVYRTSRYYLFFILMLFYIYIGTACACVRVFVRADQRQCWFILDQ